MIKFKLSQKAIDVIQWILIVLLLAFVVVQGINYNKVKRQLVTSEEYNKENTYVRIYESQNVAKLKKENRELYDSIAKLQDVESGMIIKFKEHYNTDTITKEKFVVRRDTTRIVKEYRDTVTRDNIIVRYDTIEGVDSIYHYAQNNDTIDCEIDIKAKELEWCKADVTISDKFMIINREKDGVNQTLINHSDNATIEGTTMWHRKDENKKWYNKFKFGAGVGAGYGIFNKKPDIYVGVGVSYTF